jgi:hypothetical protein
MCAILHNVQECSIVALLQYILRSWESNILYMHSKVDSVIEIFVFSFVQWFWCICIEVLSTSYRIHIFVS